MNTESLKAAEADDGGPAFPVNTANQGEGGACYPSYGMSLRDHFAGLAMQGLCANPGGPFQANDRTGWGLVNTSFLDVAYDAYAMADAMLKARKS